MWHDFKMNKAEKIEYRVGHNRIILPLIIFIVICILFVSGNADGLEDIISEQAGKRFYLKTQGMKEAETDEKVYLEPEISGMIGVETDEKVCLEPEISGMIGVETDGKVYPEPEILGMIGTEMDENALAETVPFSQNNDYYACEEVEDGYEVILYDKSGEIVCTEWYPRQPWIHEIADGILEIGISFGSPAADVIYYDQENSKITDTYFNPILFGEKYIAYMEGRKLILADIFMEGELYEVIERDFTETANPISAIISIQMLDDEHIILEYYKGADYENESEVILIAADEK